MGLDAIAITDHIEYQPHKADVSTDFNRPTDIAKGTGDSLGIIVIRGSEITRQMPPGHLNAIFLKDCSALAVPEWKDAIAAAHAQGAFIFWNHPGWKSQVPDGIATWLDEHAALHKAGMLHGIEVVNGRSYYPEAHRWTIEKNLAILCNSDVHAPIHHDYIPHAGDHRPITLVFAKERSADSIREALFERRSAALAAGTLVGHERFLRPIFDGSIRVRTPKVALRGKGRVSIQVANESDIDYTLERAEEPADVKIPERVVLPAGKVVLIDLQATSATLEGERALSLPYLVTNLLVGPDKPLAASIEVQARFTPSAPPKK